MTHDELLSRINEDDRVAHLYGYSGHQRLLKYFNSLRAVVELHQPIWTFPPGSNNSTPICLQCREGDFEADYPCPTIQAIEKELG